LFPLVTPHFRLSLLQNVCTQQPIVSSQHFPRTFVFPVVPASDALRGDGDYGVHTGVTVAFFNERAARDTALAQMRRDRFGWTGVRQRRAAVALGSRNPAAAAAAAAAAVVADNARGRGVDKQAPIADTSQFDSYSPAMCSAASRLSDLLAQPIRNVRKALVVRLSFAGETTAESSWEAAGLGVADIMASFRESNDYAQRFSYGELQFAQPTVTKPYNVAALTRAYREIDDDSYDDYFAPLLALAAADGHDACAHTDIIFVIGPARIDIGWAGWAYIGRRVIELNADVSASLFIHEFGHTMGYEHSHSYTTSSPLAPLAPGGDFKDYGDPVCVMGDGRSLFNAGKCLHVLYFSFVFARACLVLQIYSVSFSLYMLSHIHSARSKARVWRRGGADSLARLRRRWQRCHVHTASFVDFGIGGQTYFAGGGAAPHHADECGAGWRNGEHVLSFIHFAFGGTGTESSLRRAGACRRGRDDARRHNCRHLPPHRRHQSALHRLRGGHHVRGAVSFQEGFF
jgi:hypothetical protein